MVRPLPEATEIAVFGTQPPEKISYEELCPPQPSCPDCPDPRYL